METELKYTIHSCSSYSSNLRPENILLDEPTEQSSRWSADPNSPRSEPQQITLKLATPAIIRTIQFGKFHKSHVCNLRRFRVLIGMTKDNMTQVLDSALRNDSTSETFQLQTDPVSEIPAQFVQLVPLQAWGPTFNFSIWYVALFGYVDAARVEAASLARQEYSHQQVLRLCLKYFREHGLSNTYSALTAECGYDLECPLLTHLYQRFVLEGEFDRCRQLLCEAGSEGLFEDYDGAREGAMWTEIAPTGGLRPPARGGHQLVLDSADRLIYLFGGWTGTRELCDLWTFSLVDSTWRQLSADTSVQGGPSPRSCHKMCLDASKKQLFLLGRLMTSGEREPPPADFFVYNIIPDTWERLSSDTLADGGPPLVFDHQCCFHSPSRMFYVFGGRIVTTAVDSKEFSGFYSYDVATATWRRPLPLEEEPPGRIGHSMLLHEATATLRFFGGRQSKERVMSDMYTYDIGSDRLTTQLNGVDEMLPFNAFSLRATASEERVVVLSVNGRMSSELWTLRSGHWRRLSEENSPSPRFASQLVLDTETGAQYLFGGNGSSSEGRLNDLWRLDIDLPRAAIEEGMLLLAKREYEELLSGSPAAALSFLQTRLAPLLTSRVDERTELHELAARLFVSSPPPTPLSSSGMSFTVKVTITAPCSPRHHPMPAPSPNSTVSARVDLFGKLSALFAPRLRQPTDSLATLVLN